MKKSIKAFMVGLSLVLPASSFAGEVKPAAKEEVKKEEVKKEEIKVEVKESKDKDVKADHAELMLEGAKEENTAQIVKLAKEAGASKASFNSKNNTLTLSGKEFNKEKFSGSLSTSLPGVSVKN